MWNRTLTNPKKRVRVGCWNVLSMYSTGKTAQICSEANCIERECSDMRLTSLAAATSLAKKSDIWRQLISSPIPHLGARN